MDFLLTPNLVRSLPIRNRSVTIADSAGTAALVTDSRGVHGVCFDQNFMYMGLKRLKRATQLTSGKVQQHAGFPLTDDKQVGT
jgi:hypothetical protein